MPFSGTPGRRGGLQPNGIGTNRPAQPAGAFVQPSDALDDLCQRYRVRRLDLFGSATTGDFDPSRSDLDFLVTFQDTTARTYADDYASLLDGLGRLFQRPIDLVIDGSIRNPYKRASIEEQRRRLYSRA